MKNEEKKIKKYAAAVERRLNLPASLKKRVMSDFLSSIAARREAGASVEQLIQELGSPKKAAADLNEQMREFTYRKSPWRFLFAACAAYGAAELLAGLLAWLLALWLRGAAGEAASVGIIGGADGPTAIFVTTPGWMHYITPCVLLAVGIWGFLRLSKCRRKENQRD